MNSRLTQAFRLMRVPGSRYARSLHLTSTGSLKNEKKQRATGKNCPEGYTIISNKCSIETLHI